VSETQRLSAGVRRYACTSALAVEKSMQVNHIMVVKL
jgi:hypothetical protein